MKMIRVKKTFSSHDSIAIDKYKDAVEREKGKILGTATSTRRSPDGEVTDASVTIYAEIPHVIAEIDMRSSINELDEG